VSPQTFAKATGPSHANECSPTKRAASDSLLTGLKRSV
jgi:hypothetical protein